MVIKTLRWKVAGFDRLADYIGKEAGREDSFQILHNLRQTDSLREIADQFRDNDGYRRQRKNGVVLYHEILSFSGEDRDHLTPEVLEDLARQYVDLRAPKGLAFAMPHYDREHVHVHIMLSGCELRSPRTLRMDNATFTRVRRKIEAYQVERYPELKHSIVHVTKRVRSRELKEEIERERPAIEECFREARSLDDFQDRISDLGLDPSKYRLDSQLGRFDFDVDLKTLSEIDGRRAELQRLNELRIAREQGRDRDERGM